MEKLKLCPFCGNQPFYIQRDINDGTTTMSFPMYDATVEMWDIGCMTSECFLQFGADWWLSAYEANEKWNTRTLKE